MIDVVFSGTGCSDLASTVYNCSIGQAFAQTEVISCISNFLTHPPTALIAFVSSIKALILPLLPSERYVVYICILLEHLSFSFDLRGAQCGSVAVTKSLGSP